ncbi:hypothetical protein [Actinomycetospora sp. CA-084318]|uniref:hypothetical protein n=1 Tax=Actinomycetospora sp. CA-084318 TaxID=3239892 RepID=UPI003D970A19
MRLPERVATLVEWIIADSVDGLQHGNAPFAPHLMLLDDRPAPEDRTLQHTRFGPDLVEGLEQARASVGPTTPATAYAIVWDGYATVGGERSDAVLVEVGTADDRDAWLLAQPYGTVRRRFRGSRVERRGDLLEVGRAGSRLADIVPAWPERLAVAGLVHELAWRATPTPGYHKAEYLPPGQDVDAFSDMVLLEIDTRSPGPEATVAALLDVFEQGPADVVHHEVGEDGTGGIVVEFVLRAGVIREWNAHRYIDHPLGVLLLGVVRRSGDDVAPADRASVLDDLRAMAVPPLR